LGNEAPPDVAHYRSADLLLGAGDLLGHRQSPRSLFHRRSEGESHLVKGFANPFVLERSRL
jgi:hypothetical protein